MKSRKLIYDSMFLGATLGVLKGVYTQQNFSWRELLYEGAKGAGIGFAVSTPFVAFDSLLDSRKKRQHLLNDRSSTKYLRDVLETNQIDSTCDCEIEQAQYTMDVLKCIYQDKLETAPSFQGSLSKKTNIKGHSDIDVLLSFKRDSFSSLEEMYNDVGFNLQQCASTLRIKKIREQNVSFGVFFNKETKIDIVPSRRIDNTKDDYFLHVNPNQCNPVPSRKKMNPVIQKDLGENAKGKREVISLMKMLNVNQGKPLPSILIEAFTERYFDTNRRTIPRKLSDKVLETMDYIGANIESTRIVSKDNTNTVLTDSLSYTQKQKVALLMQKATCEIKCDPTNIVKYFYHNT